MTGQTDRPEPALTLTPEELAAMDELTPEELAAAASLELEGDLGGDLAELEALLTPPTLVFEPESTPEPAPEPEPEPALGEADRAALAAYFDALRAVYPDGVITRLNTGYRRLAERGAALRQSMGYAGDLDGFFALGGFTYQRSAGGRPVLPASRLADGVLAVRLREAFPHKPAVRDVQRARPRLYLDLRTAALRAHTSVARHLGRLWGGDAPGPAREVVEVRRAGEDAAQSAIEALARAAQAIRNEE